MLTSPADKQAAVRGLVIGTVVGLVLSNPISAVIAGGLSAVLSGLFGTTIDSASSKVIK